MADLTLLLPAALPAALRLSTQAGWNQLPMDWQRLLDLFPHTCFALRDRGHLLGTATLATYGHALGWVGMVLVDAAHRGQGHARTLLHACLAAADRAGISLLGLDATDLGRPVYLKLNFTDTHPITRWTRPAPSSIVNRQSSVVSPFTLSDLPALLALDRAAVNLDRSPLLTHLIHEPHVRTHIIHAQSPAPQSLNRLITESPTTLRAFALLRPGRTAWHLGPAVAETPDQILALLASLLASLPPDNPQPIFLDALDHPALDAALQTVGFRPTRRLTRMHRPGLPPASRAPAPSSSALPPSTPAPTIIPAGFELA